jgi:hypothetical protein
MAHCDMAVFEEGLDVFGKREQAQQVRNRRSILADRFGYLLMGECEFLLEAVIASRFLDCIQVSALEILDKREREHGLLVCLADQSGNFTPAELQRGSETTFSGDEFECITGWAHDNGLEHAGGLE